MSFLFYIPTETQVTEKTEINIIYPLKYALSGSLKCYVGRNLCFHVVLGGEGVRGKLITELEQNSFNMHRCTRWLVWGKIEFSHSLLTNKQVSKQIRTNVGCYSCQSFRKISNSRSIDYKIRSFHWNTWNKIAFVSMNQIVTFRKLTFLSWRWRCIRFMGKAHMNLNSFRVARFVSV